MPNALAAEKSPYLLQHADNPVHWQPWGEAAFAQARREDKPIFLSIGYATCHWCHVMAHESFENAAVAERLNEHFVAIKVDREERPDVDKVYMAYVQALTGHGGWPLSAWLTPDLKPFYGGTYFPPEDRPGRPGFPSVLRAIAENWRKDRAMLVAEGDRVLGALREHRGRPVPAAGAESLAAAAGAAFEQGFQYFYENFDAAHGGFGGAPKFPRASNLSFLFRCAALQGATGDLGREAIRLATATLRAMARGGIHDHVGGGFHRYAVDEAWFVPHFEKMLYDQAQIAANALEAYQATGDGRFAWLARDIFDYVARDLTGPDGGFYSAEDADSDVGDAPDPAAGRPAKARHAEGAFYVWAAAELRSVLGADYALGAQHFGVEDGGNVPRPLDPHGEFTAKNILTQRRSLAETARQFSISPEQANDRLLAVLAALRTARSARPRPLRDDKVITAWNGLMISALALGGRVLGSGAAPAVSEAESAPGPDYLAAAVRAAEFVERELYDADRGVLFRCWRNGRAAAEGFAEDYAGLVQGLLDLYETNFDGRWLRWAVTLQAKMDELFWDAAAGGYFNSAAGDANLVLRLKEDYDGAEPAPSSVAALNLLRLGAMLHDDSHRARGRACLEAFRATWTRAPQAMPQMLCALELALEAPRHVVLAGDPAAADFRALAAVVHRAFGPRRAVLRADPAIPWTAAMRPIDGRATAFVCEDYTCQRPVTDPAELRRMLAGAGVG